MNVTRRAASLFLLFGLLAGNTASAGDDLIIVGAPGGNGIYDPSLVALTENKLWLSYSAVQPLPDGWPPMISSRLARSDDGGLSWLDIQAVAPAARQALPPPHDKLKAVWANEVSRLFHVPSAPKTMQWQVLYHRYLSVWPAGMPEAIRLFEHGWIELRQAGQPEGPWSEPRKLFAGGLYNPVNNNNLGAPDQRLDKLFPQQLGRCLAFTEPGVLVRGDKIYLALKCAAGKDSSIEMLSCDLDFKTCQPAGRLLTDADAARLGDYASWSAPELFEKNNKTYLLVTPTTEPHEEYRGCMLFELEGLNPARLTAKEPLWRTQFPEGAIGGACAFHPASATGLLVSRFQTAPPFFHIQATGQALAP